MVVVPPAIPVTTPVPELMVAVVVLELLQVPPPGVEPSVVVDPWHTDAVPVMPVGTELTVAAAVV
jgi:hypothetical protein